MGVKASLTKASAMVPEWALQDAEAEIERLRAKIKKLKSDNDRLKSSSEGEIDDASYELGFQDGYEKACGQ